MYVRYAETVGWKVDILNESESQTGGYKEVIAAVSGAMTWSWPMMSAKVSGR